MSDTQSLRAIEILLVEDSPTDRLIATEALGRSKMINSVHVVENGVDAMSFLRREGKFSAVRRPDLILLDLNLPKKDGREVLAEVKSDPLLKFIPVIVLTTSESDEDLLRAYGNHANSYITKPVDFPRFTEALRALGGYWFEIVTLPPEAAIERIARRDPPRSSPPARTCDAAVRVLLIEDSPTDVELFRIALERNHMVRFDLSQVTRLADARERLRSDAFDLVMVDLGLPDSLGLDTYRQVRRCAPGLAIIVLTALDDDDTGVQALREGAQDYLVKGQLTPRALARAARYAIDRKAHQEQLRQSQRLESVGRLAAGVAHDFNNILAVIRGNAELLTAALTLEEVAEPAQDILEAADRGIRLSRQLLTFSRQQRMVPKPLDLNDVVGKFARMLRRLVGEGIRLELHLAAELPLILADIGMLEQILLNLAVNGRDAMTGGGKLTVQTAALELTPALARSSGDGYAGRFVRLSVSDTGAGIEPELVAKIFEPFFTTKAVGQGTGLGLATVHGIVQQHRGWIHVTSTLGSGSTFEVFLPVTLEKAENSAARRISVRPLKAATILLVEDDAMLRELAAKVLRAGGYSVLAAGSASEALSVWALHADGIEILLTDLVLSDDSSGRQLAETLLASRPALRVVFTSGFSPDFVQEDLALEEGVNFLQKPYPLEHLLMTIGQVLDRAPKS